MKTNLLLLAATFTLCHTAFAQSSTTVAPAANAASASSTSTATSAVPAGQEDTLKPAIKYLGYMHGTGLDFSGAHQAGINDGGQLTYEQRIKLLPFSNKKFDGGVEARINTNFGDGSKWNTANGAWRLYGSFKNVLNNDVYNLTLMPRIVLPTSNKLHNQKTTFSPDLIAELGISPKNSRWSFDSGIEFIQYLHLDGANDKDTAAAHTSLFAPWLEADYQLTEKTQLMLSYWPTWVANRNGVAMTSAFAQEGGNEIDAGAYYEFVKGWQVNPFVAMEMSDIGNHAPVSRNLQANFLIIGQVL